MGKGISINKLCRCCMASMASANSSCPVCGFDKEWYSAPREHLRLDFILASRYMVGISVAEDDYEISYIGWDLRSNKKVLIKEYYPKGLITREKSDSVAVILEDKVLVFEEKVRQYLYMAENIAKLNNFNSIAKVVDYFYENHTAYLVTEYPDGVTSEKYLQTSNGKMEPEDAVEVMKTIVGTMARVHEAGLVHDEIAPYNILVTSEGEIKLLGLSPAVVLKRAEDISVHKDVYDACKTMYRLLTGQYPLSSEENKGHSNNSENVRPSELGISISPEIEEVLMRGLSPNKSSRFGNMMELYMNMFGGKQKKMNANGVYKTSALGKQRNQTVIYKKYINNQNQLKDGPSVMNSMNDLNGQRLGQGQPRMNPAGMNEPSRVNPAGADGRPRVNMGNVNGQPRMPQPNMNQRPEQMQQKGGENPNMQRMNPNGQPMPNARPVVPPNGPQRSNPNNIPPNGPQGPNGQQHAAVFRQGMPPQQGMRGPIPPQQGMPPQGMGRPNMQNNDPMMGGMPVDNNRRGPVPVGRVNRAGAQMGNAEGKTANSKTKIITYVACALIIGVTVFNVIKMKTSNSKANDGNIQPTKNVQNTTQDDTNVNKDGSSDEKPKENQPIEVYDVVWKSPVVEEFARQETGILDGVISTADLENITEIRLSKKEIDTVEDFVHFQRLTILELKTNKIKDLSPLANHKSLEEIDLSNNNFATVDISPLNSIPTLKKVNLLNSKVMDYSSLSNVPLVIGRACDVVVDFYYTRQNADYTGWNLWVWTTGDGTQYDFEENEGFARSRFTVNTFKDEVGFIIRRGDWEEKELNADRYMKLTSNNETVYVTVRVNQGQSDFECICE